MNVEYCEENGTLNGQRRRLQFYSSKEKEFRRNFQNIQFRSISVYKLEEIDHAYHSADLSFYFGVTQPNDIESLGDFVFSLNDAIWKDLVNQDTLLKVFNDFLNISETRDVKTVYGLIAKMLREKKAIFYTSGIGNFDLIKGELKSVDLFSLKGNEIEKNFGSHSGVIFINESHLKSKKHYDDLIDLLGKENVFSLSVV